MYPWSFRTRCNARLWAVLGRNPALESNLQLVSSASETAELRMPEKGLEGLGGLDSLV